MSLIGYPTHGQTPRPPAAVPPDDATRWAESSRRRQLLEGTWRELLDERVRTLVGTLRRDAWGETSLAINPLANICRELSVLYDTPPDIRHDIAPIDDLSNRVRVSGLWPMMQRVQYYTRGLGNMLVRADASKDGSLTYRPVFPDMSTAQAKPERPDIPVAVQEFRERTVDGQREWTCDVLDVSDPENPVYRVILIRNTRDGNGKSSDEQTDITAKVLGADMSGDAYPYRRRDGTPVLPYVLYHATRNGYRLWQPFEWMELVEGTLDAAVLHQMLMHTWRDASWPQRYTVNLSVRGGGAVQTADGRPSGAMVTDPASLLEFESPVDREENTQPMVGQFQPGGDIAVMERGIADFVARLAQSADVPPSDIQRMTGQAQSGAAISLNNEGKRSAQRRYAESFRDSDERLMMVSAILLNRATAGTPGATDYIEGGYRVVYREIPVSPQEREARRDEALELLAAGIIGPIRAYMSIYPDANEEDARKELAAAAAHKAGTVEPSPVPPAPPAPDEPDEDTDDPTTEPPDNTTD